MAQVRYLFNSNIVAAVMGLWLAGLLAATYWPATFWLDVRSVQAGPAHAGKSVPMLVDRSIRRRFLGDWTVSVRRWDESRGFIVHCVAAGRTQYLPDAQFPADLTLEWWTWGVCPTLPRGRYFVSTTWEIRPTFPGLPAKSVTADSNIFEVSPP